MADGTEAKAADEAIAALSDALSRGAAEQELAARRLTGLSDTINRLEASRREAERLRAETERLSLALKKSEAELESKVAWAEEQNNRYTAIKTERDELRRQHEAATASLAKADEAGKDLKSLLARIETEMGAERARAQAEAERAELATIAQTKLSEETAKKSAALTAQKHKITELSRATEDLTERLADKTQSSEQAVAALRELRSEHAGTKEKLIEALNTLQAAEYRATRQDAAHNEALSRRADEITTLRRQVEQLSAELRIKDGVGVHYDRDLAEMRATLEAERERRGAVEARLRELGDTEKRQAQALAQSKIDYDALSEKFTDAMRDIEALRKVNGMQRKHLERYAELSGAPSPKSDNSPEPVRPVRVVTGRKFAG